MLKNVCTEAKVLKLTAKYLPIKRFLNVFYKCCIKVLTYKRSLGHSFSLFQHRSRYFSTKVQSTQFSKHNRLEFLNSKVFSGGKAVPLQDWSGPEDSRNLRFADFMTTAQDGGKVVSLTHRPPVPPGNVPGTHFR